MTSGATRRRQSRNGSAPRCPDERVSPSAIPISAVSFSTTRPTGHTWSSPYRSSGQLNRSPDGRQYLQFRATFLTDDVLSIGRLDSLQFEISPLLASSLIGEVSLAGAASTGLTTEAQPAEFPVGERRQLHFDIAATSPAIHRDSMPCG